MLRKRLNEGFRTRYRAINEAKENKYEIFYKSGETEFYNDPDDCSIDTFTTVDDFHAYVMIFIYMHERDDFTICFDEDTFNEYLEDLEQRYKTEITIDWIRSQLEPFRLSRSHGNKYAELYYIKRNGRIIDKFDDAPSFFRNSRVKAEINRTNW